MSSKFELFYTFDPSDPPRYHHKLIDEEYFEWLFSMLEGTGMTFLYRCNLAGRAYYPSKLMSKFDHSCIDHRNPDAAIWHRVVEFVKGQDPLAGAVRAARKHNIKIFAWFNWNEFHNVRRNWISLIDPEWFDRPRKFWCNRDGSRFYHGVPDFGDIEVQNRLTGLCKEVMDYDVDGFYLSTRSHSWTPCWMSPGSNEQSEPFGFNQSVVDAYYKKHGVDIRYEDYDKEQWNKIKGEHFSTLINKTGTIVHSHNKKFIIGISPDRHNLMGMGDQWAGKKNLQLYKDWEGWISEGSIDGLCAEKSCPHEKVIPPSDISLFKETTDNFPLYSWLDTSWFINRGAGPFAMGNWSRLSPDEVIEQIEMAKNSGAAGAFAHSLYHFTASDTNGEFIGVDGQGYGILPRTEYFDKLREYNNESHS